MAARKLSGRPVPRSHRDDGGPAPHALPSGDALDLLAAEADELATQLDLWAPRAHLDDEEAQACSLVDDALNDDEFASFEKATAKSVGMRGAARFFPWILDGASEDDRKAALHVPPSADPRRLPISLDTPVRAPARPLWTT